MSTDSKFLQLLNSGLDQTSVPNGATLVVAFSGGPDSSALLVGLAALNDQREFNLIAAHVNHKIRPEASAQDQLTAQHIAESLGVEFVTENIDVPGLAKKNKISIESSARTYRYKALANIAAASNAFGVVTGHTGDDQAETVLHHAARGSGLKGIAGMSFNSKLKIVDENIDLTVLRPMLDTPRSECIAFCSESNITPVTDESNSSREYTRNKLRLDVLPALNDAVPEATRALARLAKNASDDLEIVEWVVERHLIVAQTSNNSYSRLTVEALPDSLIARMLMRAYENHTGHSLNLERTHIWSMANLLAGHSGTSIELPNNVEFFVDKDIFGFRFADDDDCPYPSELKTVSFELPGSTELGSGITLSANIVDRPVRLDSGNPNVAFASPSLASHSLKLRTRQNGDRFQPLGMEPLVKLQDFFVGAGVPERWRNRVPIIDSDQGIIWIAGYRLAEWAKVLPEHDQVARFELVGINR